jgi:hypothetical protein
MGDVDWFKGKMCFEIKGLGSTFCCKGRLFGVGFGGGGGSFSW